MRFLSIALLLTLLSSTLSAQVGRILIGSAGVTVGKELAVGCGPLAPQAGVIPSPVPPHALPLGGHAFDPYTHIQYETDGTVIMASPHPLYTPTGPILPPAPGPTVICAGGPFGPITGMCVVPAVTSPPLPIPPGLWVTDGRHLIGLAIAPGYPIIWNCLPFTAGLAPMTGIEWDSVTQTFWTCDIQGNSYQWTPNAIPLAGPIAPAGPVFGIVGGNILDRSTASGPCTSLPSLYVTDGISIIPVAGPGLAPPGAVLPVPSPGGAPGSATGASFIAEALALPGACNCGSLTPRIWTSTPVVGGSPNPFSINLSSGPGASPAYLFIDANCGAGVPFGSGCTWWMPAGAAWIGPIITTAAGDASVPFGSLPLCPGLTVYAQWLMICPTAVPPITVTDALHLRLAAP